MKSVLLVGSGGVGTVASLGLEIGGKAEVTMVVRSDYSTVSQNGFEIDSIDHGKVKNWLPKGGIAKSIDEAAQLKSYDYILVCTKVLPELYKTEELIVPAVSENTVIVLMQNGIGIERPVAERFPENIVLSGVSMIGSVNYHGKIHQEEPDRCQLGYHSSPGIASAKLEAAAKDFVDIYAASGVKCQYAPNLTKSRWRKLVYNSCINPVCAATQLDAGRCYLAGLDQSIILPAMQEIKNLAKVAMGEELDEGIDTWMLESDDGIYYKPSMQIDLEKGNPIELEAILGNPLKIARELKVDCPVLSVIYCILKGIQFRLMEERGHITCPTEGASRTKHDRIWTTPYY